MVKDGYFDGSAFARRLKALREERGVDQDGLAELSGVSKGSIARYETGRNMPGIETACALADALNVSVDTLLAREPLTGVA